MNFTWTYRRWNASQSLEPERLLDASALVATAEGQQRHTPTTDDWIHYAEVAYLSCRILMISSETVHLEALYCAGHVLERGMKAVMHYRGLPIPGGQSGHHLAHLATTLAGEFINAEFLEVCRLLQPFQEAGRYPDNRLLARAHSLNLLTFLDGFLVHIRDLAGKADGCDSLVAELAHTAQGGNPVMVAAAEAVLVQNAFRQELGLPSLM